MITGISEEICNYFNHKLSLLFSYQSSEYRHYFFNKCLFPNHIHVSYIEEQTHYDKLCYNYFVCHYTLQRVMGDVIKGHVSYIPLHCMTK